MRGREGRRRGGIGGGCACEGGAFVRAGAAGICDAGVGLSVCVSFAFRRALYRVLLSSVLLCRVLSSFSMEVVRVSGTA